MSSGEGAGTSNPNVPSGNNRNLLCSIGSVFRQFFQSAIMPDYWQLLGALSALTPKADTALAELHVRYGPQADIDQD
jgi:hypothetical protein